MLRNKLGIANPFADTPAWYKAPRRDLFRDADEWTAGPHRRQAPWRGEPVRAVLLPVLVKSVGAHVVGSSAAVIRPVKTGSGRLLTLLKIPFTRPAAALDWHCVEGGSVAVFRPRWVTYRAGACGMPEIDRLLYKRDVWLTAGLAFELEVVDEVTPPTPGRSQA